MNGFPPQVFLKKSPNQQSVILQNAMARHIMQQPYIPTQVQKPLYKPIPPGIKIPPEFKMKHRQTYQSQQSQLNPQKLFSRTNEDMKLPNMSYSHNITNEPIEGRVNQQIIPNGSYTNLATKKKRYVQKQSEKNNPIKNFPVNSQNLSQRQPFAYSNQKQLPKFHESYFVLSNFPLLLPNDQVYLPKINRLQNLETKFCFNELYINLKFLLVQPDQDFWRYLAHLHQYAHHGMSDDDIYQGYKLRLALESCLTNFAVKQFNKCISQQEVKASSVAISKKIYQYEAIFESTSFKTYERLMNTVFQFYEKLIKAKNLIEIDIVVGSWYIDTIKALDIAMIYGNKQPNKVKQLIKKMFSINPKVYVQDFKMFLKTLHCYIQTSCGKKQSQNSLSLLQFLTRQIQALPNSKRKKSNFQNPQKYFARQMINLCSQCLKLFMMVTNIFKFFPSHIKIIFMENIDFLRSLIKISCRVIYNLRQIDSVKKRRWKFTQKVRQSLKDLDFIMMEKITQMYKFLFLNAKNALEQQIFVQPGHQKDQLQSKNEKTVTKFYKKLIEGTVNRRIDQRKDKNLEENLNKRRKQESNQTTNVDQNILEKEWYIQQKQIEKNESNAIERSSSQNKVYSQSQKGGIKQTVQAQQKEEEKDQIKQGYESKRKHFQKSSKIKVPERQFGRVLMKFLLIKQLKKNESKYLNSSYFYSEKLLSYYREQLWYSKTMNFQEGSESNGQNSKDTNNNSNSKEINARSMLKRILLLEQFEQQIKQEYVSNQEFDSKYRKLDILVRQLPSLQQFEVREKRLKFQEVMKSLTETQYREYDDEPNEEEQMELYWQERLLNDEDFTAFSLIDQDEESINFNCSVQAHKKNKVPIDRSKIMVMETVSQNDISFGASAGIKKHGNNFNNKNDYQVWNASEDKTKGKKRQKDGRRNKKFQDQSSQSQEEELSPQEITEQEFSCMMSSSFASSNNLQSSITSPYIKSSSFQSSPLKNSHDPSNLSKIKIFKPHELMSKLTQSMLKEELQYFEKIQNLNWHQISRISVKKGNKDENRRKMNKSATSNNDRQMLSDTSRDLSLMDYHQLIKVRDIGYSFDMILDQEQTEQNNTESNTLNHQTTNNNNVVRHTHFYYNHTKDKKSFMQDYQFSNVNEEYNSEDQNTSKPKFDTQRHQSLSEEKQQKAKQSFKKKADSVQSVKKNNEIQLLMVRKDYANFMSAKNYGGVNQFKADNNNDQIMGNLPIATNGTPPNNIKAMQNNLINGIIPTIPSIPSIEYSSIGNPSLQPHTIYPKVAVNPNLSYQSGKIPMMNMTSPEIMGNHGLNPNLVHNNSMQQIHYMQQRQMMNPQGCQIYVGNYGVQNVQYEPNSFVPQNMQYERTIPMIPACYNIPYPSAMFIPPGKNSQVFMNQSRNSFNGKR